MKKNVVAVLITFTVIGGFYSIFSYYFNRSEVSQKENYRDGRLTALSLVQVQKVNGLSLSEYFKKQKEENVIGTESRWVVFKENEHYIVIYKRDFSTLESSVSDEYAQWVVLPQNDLELFSDAKIYALNGTAKSFTPELSSSDPLQGEVLSTDRMLQLFEEQGDIYTGE